VDQPFAASGFGQMRELFVAPTNLLRVYSFRAKGPHGSHRRIVAFSLNPSPSGKVGRFACNRRV
jgi:hypothetical protein